VERVGVNVMKKRPMRRLEILRFLSCALPAALLLAATSWGLAASAEIAKPRQNRPPAPTGPPPDTSYLAGMPTVDQVKSTIQGSDPTDTLARQVAACNILVQLIEVMGEAPARQYGDATPAETNLASSYSAAAYQITQDYGKTHTADELKAFNTLHAKYELLDNSVHDEIFQKLLTSAFLDAYNNRNSPPPSANGTPPAQRGNQNPAPARAGNGAPTGPPGSTGSFGGAGDLGVFDPSNLNPSQNSPPTKEQARCLELGGSKSDCMGGALTGLLAGLADYFGVDTSAPAAPHGPVMVGQYKAANGMVLNFNIGPAPPGQSVVGLSGCGNLAELPITYTMALSSNGYLLQITNSPNPLPLTLNSGGQVVGSGGETVTGQVITGYRTVTTTEYHNGKAVPGSTATKQVPIYAPATVRCSFGTFAPQTPPPAAKPSATQAALFGADTSGATPPPGVEMSGVYSAAGGLRVEFQYQSVVLDCGQAHVLKTYSLQKSGGQLSITVANDKPFTLVLQPNGSLSGSGVVTLNGRLLSGEDTNGKFFFSPISASCNVSTLAAN
jgi:hypothetical protein